MTRNLHHANLLLGAPEEAESYLHSLCKSLGVKLVNNPDFFAFRMSTFGIDEARELSRLSAHKAVTQRKVFLDSLLLLLKNQKQASNSVENVYNVRRFASDPAVSSRLIIEHLSLVL